MNFEVSYFSFRFSLFFVGHPTAPSMEALYDVYCRYGNFAGATVMARKNYGYLYFTSSESAHKAIKVIYTYKITTLTVMMDSKYCLRFIHIKELSNQVATYDIIQHYHEHDILNNISVLCICILCILDPLN